MYCEYDTGHDKSPRVRDGGIPHTCPDREASRMPEIACMPIIAPDLSAMLYSYRVALSEMAKALGLKSESAAWLEKSDKTKRQLYKI